MKIAPLADVKARLSAYLEKCEVEGPIVITRNGKVAAVLLTPTNDEDLECLLLARSPRFQALLARSRESVKAGKGLSSREFWKAVARRPPRNADFEHASKTAPSKRPNQNATAAASTKRGRG